MKNKLFTLAAALMLAAVIGGVYAAPALAAVIKAALVKNVDEPGRAPFQFTDSCTGTGSCNVILPVVPAGKRLVLENLNALVNVGQGGALGSVSVAEPGGALAYFTGEVISPGSATFDSNWAVNGMFRHYVEAGQAAQVTAAARAGGLSMSMFFSVTGYFVDLTI